MWSAGCLLTAPHVPWTEPDRARHEDPGESHEGRHGHLPPHRHHRQTLRCGSAAQLRGHDPDVPGEGRGRALAWPPAHISRCPSASGGLGQAQNLLSSLAWSQTPSFFSGDSFGTQGTSVGLAGGPGGASEEKFWKLSLTHLSPPSLLCLLPLLSLPLNFSGFLHRRNWLVCSHARLLMSQCPFLNYPGLGHRF